VRRRVNKGYGKKVKESRGAVKTYTYGGDTRHSIEKRVEASETAMVAKV
jgi:hypothetical protein